MALQLHKIVSTFIYLLTLTMQEKSYHIYHVSRSSTMPTQFRCLPSLHVIFSSFPLSLSLIPNSLIFLIDAHYM